MLAVVTVPATAVPGTLDCTTAARLQQMRVKPVWFPFPQPAGFVLRVNSTVPSSAVGLQWRAGTKYFFLARVPGGTNWGGTVVAAPVINDLGGRTEILRDVGEEGSLWAFWPTSGRYLSGRRWPADITYAAAKGQTPARLTAFLRSLRRITWPTCPPASARIAKKEWGISFVRPPGYRITTNTRTKVVLEGEEFITIDYAAGVARFTDTDTKFGAMTLYWSATKGKWLMEWDPEQTGRLRVEEAKPLRYLFPNVPVFQGIGRWQTYIVALTHTSFLRFNITGGGNTKPLDDLLKTVRKI